MGKKILHIPTGTILYVRGTNTLYTDLEALNDLFKGVKNRDINTLIDRYAAIRVLENNNIITYSETYQQVIKTIIEMKISIDEFEMFY